MNIMLHHEIERVNILLEDAGTKESFVEAYGSLVIAVRTLAEIVEALHQSKLTNTYYAKNNAPKGLDSPGNDG